MYDRFIKFIPSDEANWLRKNKPTAFILLSFIAERARREPDHPDGLKPGQCHIGDWKSYGLTEKQYRTAKDILVMRGHIKIVETCRTRKKSATGTTTYGTLVELISSSIYDINKNIEGDRKGDRGATEGRPRGDEQESEERKRKKEEGASERARDPKIEHIGQHNVQNETGQNLPADSLASRSPLLSEEKKQDLLLLSDLCFYEKITIKESDLEQWLRKYPGGYIADHIQELIKRLKNPNANIENQAAWMTSALHRNYTQEQKNISINREFAIKFKSENNWTELDILQKYCTHERSSYDLYFKNDPKDFKKYLVQKYKNCAGVA